MLARMEEAMRAIESCREMGGIMPEVRMNIAYAKERAKSPQDVAAVDGRITMVNGMPKAAGEAKFGASSHMARMIIELGREDPKVRAGINFVYTPELGGFLRGYCEKKGWLLGEIDRGKEPEAEAKEEIPSMPWKAAEAVRSGGGKVPKVFYEHGAVGKEDLTVLVGETPEQVAREACELAREYSLWTR